MKKLKIMLLSFALLAIVGSALAFKARFSGQQFCTAATNGASSDICTVSAGLNQFCPNLVNKTTVDPVNGRGSALVCTTTPNNPGTNADCNNIRCETTTTIYND